MKKLIALLLAMMLMLGLMTGCGDTGEDHLDRSRQQHCQHRADRGSELRGTG